MKKLLLHPATLAVLAAILAAYGKLALATARVTVLSPLPSQLAQKPLVLAIWHQQLAGVPLLKQPLKTPLMGLMSASRDGRFTTKVAGHFGIGSIAGSSHKGAVPATRQLIRAARGGSSLFLTPDGPRGPARQAKPGATQIAQFTNLPLIPCAVWAHTAITFGSWDKLRLPLPFSRITVAYGVPLATLSPQALTAELGKLTAKAQEALAAVDSKTPNA